MTVVKHQLFPQKPPDSSLSFSRTAVQPSPGSSTNELPSAFTESGLYPPDRALPGSPRQCSLPLAGRHPPEGHQIGARKRRAPGNTILSQPYRRPVSTDRLNREGSQLTASLEGEPGPSSSTIELPSAFTESGLYPPDRALPGSPRQCSLPLAGRHPPEGHQIGARKRRVPGNTILSQPYRRCVSTDRLNREGSQLAASLECEPGPTPGGKTLPHSYPETRFRREAR